MAEHTRTLLAVVTGSLLSSMACAEVLVLTPLLPSRNVDMERVHDLFTLMSSELEFMDGVDEVIEVRKPPASFTTECLDSTRCLGSLTRENEGEVLLTGTVSRASDELVLDLRYYDAGINRIVRRRSFALSEDSTEMVRQMTPTLVEILTGTSPIEARKEAEMVGVSFEQEDDFDFATPVETVRPTTIASVEPEEPAAPAVAFSFGSTVDTVTFEDEEGDDFAPEDEDLTSGDDLVFIEEGGDLEEHEQIETRASALNLDEGRKPARAPRQERASYSGGSTYTRTPRSSAEGKPPAVTVGLGMGYGRYGLYNFMAPSARIDVRAFKSLYVGAGLDTYIVKREERVEGTGDTTIATHAFFPLSAGATWLFSAHKTFRPYLGADVQLVQNAYSTTPSTGDKSYHWAVGGRARLGTHVMFNKFVGFMAEASAGVLSSQHWYIVDSRLPATGFHFNARGGLILAF